MPSSLASRNSPGSSRRSRPVSKYMTGMQALEAQKAQSRQDLVRSQHWQDVEQQKEDIEDFEFKTDQRLLKSAGPRLQEKMKSQIEEQSITRVKSGPNVRPPSPLSFYEYASTPRKHSDEALRSGQEPHGIVFGDHGRYKWVLEDTSFASPRSMGVTTATRKRMQSSGRALSGISGSAGGGWVSGAPSVVGDESCYVDLPDEADGLDWGDVNESDVGVGMLKWRDVRVTTASSQRRSSGEILSPSGLPQPTSPSKRPFTSVKQKVMGNWVPKAIQTRSGLRAKSAGPVWTQQTMLEPIFMPASAQGQNNKYTVPGRSFAKTPQIVLNSVETKFEALEQQKIQEFQFRVERAKARDEAKAVALMEEKRQARDAARQALRDQVSNRFAQSLHLKEYFAVAKIKQNSEKLARAVKQAKNEDTRTRRMGMSEREVAIEASHAMGQLDAFEAELEHKIARDKEDNF